jgi:CHAD domain-containing protein
VSGHTEGLHKTRVASRRIREALPIVGATASPGKIRKLNKKMRALTRSLGPIRELDVELGLLENRSKTDGVSDRAVEIVRREVASRRRVLRDELADMAQLGDLKKLLKKLERVGGKASKREEVAEKKPNAKRHKREEELEVQWRRVLATRLMRRSKSVATALHSAGPLYVPERLHDVRISSKKLRYALEIASDAGVTAAMPLIRILKRHQERLGHLHDLQVLLKHVRETEASHGAGSKGNELTMYADWLDVECRRLHADYVERRAEIASVVKDVRHQVVPSLAAPSRRQAPVAGLRRPAMSAGRANQ